MVQNFFYTAIFLITVCATFTSCKKQASCNYCNNTAPLANAGRDTIINLPNDAVTLNGNGSSDIDNNIIGYVWTKISGPSAFDLANSNSIQTQVTSLVAGVYQFQLRVIDAGGLTAFDTVQITVKLSMTSSETIFDNLTWNFWQDTHEINNGVDKVYLEIDDTTNLFSHTPVYVFVRPESSGTWIQVPQNVNGGHCISPYSFFISSAASPNTMVLWIDSCPFDRSLTGTGASIKILY